MQEYWRTGVSRIDQRGRDVLDWGFSRAEGSPLGGCSYDDAWSPPPTGLNNN